MRAGEIRARCVNHDLRVGREVEVAGFW